MLLPVAATITGLRVWRLWYRAGGRALGFVVVGCAAGIVVGVLVAWLNRTRPAALAKLPYLLFVLMLGWLRLSLSRRTHLAPPVYLELPWATFLTAFFVVGLVVAVLWLTGYYRVEVGHYVDVWLHTSLNDNDGDTYQAICSCSWRSRWHPASEPNAEEHAFAIARDHSPNVAWAVQVGGE